MRCRLARAGTIWSTLRAISGVTRITSMAISAVDVALWDLKGKILGQPVYALLGAVRERVPVYGSGGFTAYSETQLCEQLAGWVQAAIPRVKMKIGRNPEADIERCRAAARRAIGADAELFVDANGAYSVQEAISQAQRFAEQRVTWFEEPVFREDYVGTRRVRALAARTGDFRWRVWVRIV